VWLLRFTWWDDEVVAVVNGCAGQEVSEEGSRAKRYSKTGQDIRLIGKDSLASVVATGLKRSSHSRNLPRRLCLRFPEIGK